MRKNWLIKRIRNSIVYNARWLYYFFFPSRLHYLRKIPYGFALRKRDFAREDEQKSWQRQRGDVADTVTTTRDCPKKGKVWHGRAVMSLIYKAKFLYCNTLVCGESPRNIGNITAYTQPPNVSDSVLMLN